MRRSVEFKVTLKNGVCNFVVFVNGNNEFKSKFAVNDRDIEILSYFEEILDGDEDIEEQDDEDEGDRIIEKYGLDYNLEEYSIEDLGTFSTTAFLKDNNGEFFIIVLTTVCVFFRYKENTYTLFFDKEYTDEPNINRLAVKNAFTTLIKDLKRLN